MRQRLALFSFLATLVLLSQGGCSSKPEALPVAVGKAPEATPVETEKVASSSKVDVSPPRAELPVESRPAMPVPNAVPSRERLAQELADLPPHKERLGIADFEVRGDIGIPAAGRTLAEELLPAFKSRFDLVERSQISRVLDELKLQGNDWSDQDQSRLDVGRLAKIRYLVLGSITQMNGITVRGRLVDLRTGLIVQTAKMAVATSQELLSRLPELSRMLLMTGDRERCLAAGMDGYISKPIQPKELAEIIHQVMSRFEQPVQPSKVVKTPPQPLFNREKLLSRVDGDECLLQEIVALFLVDSPKLLTDIRKALDAGDCAWLKHAAHQMKGAVSTFEATRVFQAALDLEGKGHQGDLSRTEEMFATLESELDQLRIGLATLAPAPEEAFALAP